jgi:hypothetical protein
MSAPAFLPSPAGLGSAVLAPSARAPPRRRPRVRTAVARRRAPAAVFAGGGGGRGRGEPEFLAEMDAREAARRAACDPEGGLSDAELEALFDAVPALRRVDEGLAKLLADEPGLDPDDAAVWTWAWRRMQPLFPRWVVVGARLAGGGAAAVVARRRVRALVARVGWEGAALLAVRVDVVATAVLVGALLPALLVGVFVRRPRHSDAPRRLVLGFAAAAAVWLPAPAALVSAGFLRAGLAAGAAGRLFVLPAALWMWSDLGQEVMVMRVAERMLVGRAVAAWRWTVSLTVLLGGGLLRVAALWGMRGGRAGGGWGQAVRDVMLAHSVQARLAVASRFPVAMSLFADPGGLAFLAALALTVGAWYVLYVMVFVTEFMRIRFQRRTRSMVVDALIEWGVYRPNNMRAHRERLLSTAPPGVAPHFPVPAMMLRRPPSLDWMSGGIKTEQTPPFLTLLDEELEMMKTKGMARWNPPRNEFVPLSSTMTPDRRRREFLNTWARPLHGEDAGKGFADFFESIADEAEYEYNPETEEWVFAKDSKWLADHAATSDGGAHGGDADDAATGEPTAEAKVPDFGDPDSGTLV